MEEIIKINKARIPILIGHNGETKKLLEKKVKISLDIDSHEGEVIIVSDKSYFEIYVAKKIIEAIGRGFNPDIALLLLYDDYVFENFQISDYSGKNNKRMIQLKGRVIGKEGKIKNMIEKKYSCHISVFGKTVSVICKDNVVDDIKKIITSLLSGVRHSTVFKMFKFSSSGFNLKNFDKQQKTKEIDDITF